MLDFYKCIDERYLRKARNENFEDQQILNSMPSNITRHHISPRESELTIEYAIERLGQKSGSLPYFWYGTHASFYLAYIKDFPLIFRDLTLDRQSETKWFKRNKFALDLADEGFTS